MAIQLLRGALLLATLTLVTGCGGGGGSSNNGGGGGAGSSGGNTNSPPMFASATDFTFAETEAISFFVEVSDADGDTVTVTVGTSGDGQFFLLNTGTGEITANTSDGRLDFENPSDADSDNVYEQRVTLDDGTTQVTETFTVTITDVDEGPAFTNATTTDLFENFTGPLMTFTAEDPEGSAVQDFRIDQISKFGEVVNSQRLLDAFSLDAATGELSVLVPFDADIEDITRPIELSVSAADAGGIRSSSSLQITLIDLPAVVTEGASIRGRRSFLSLGTELASIGDIDGDGKAEIWVTEALPEAFRTEEPEPVETAWLLFGQAIDDAINNNNGAADIAITDFSTTEIIEVTGETYTDFGVKRSSLIAQSAGDVDGDGTMDVLVGFRELREEQDVDDTEDGPLAAIVYGSALVSQMSGSLDLTALTAEQGFYLGGLSRRAALGLELAVGDVDSDGRSDVILSSPSTSGVRVIFGSTLAMVPGGTTLDLGDTAAGAALLVEFVDVNLSVRFGIVGPVAAVADVDGTGGDELVVASTDGIDRWVAVISDTAIANAKALGAELNAFDPNTDDVVLLTVPDVLPLELNGKGDLDGDGNNDLAIVYRSDNLRSEVASVVFSTALANSLASDTDLALFTANPSEAVTLALSDPSVAQTVGVETSVRLIPDINGDLFGELVVGLDQDDAQGRENSGSILLINGSSLINAGSSVVTVARDNLSPDEGRRLIGPSAAAFIGAQIAIGDVAGDTNVELLLSSDTATEGTDPLGRLFVLPAARLQQVLTDPEDQYDLADSFARETPPTD